MGFLRKLGQVIGVQAASTGPTDQVGQAKVGPASGDPVARALVQRMAKGEWLPFAEAVATETDVHRRDFLLQVGAETFDGRPPFIESWPSSRPDFGLAVLLRGMQTVDWAWQGRGRLSAAQTSDAAFKVFHERLAQAGADLGRATQLLPGDAQPWASLLPVAMGLSAPVEEIRRLWANVRERDPWHPAAAPKVVTALAAKWSGSDEDMFDFVRKSVAYAPDGSTVHECMPLAHWHVFMDRGTRDYFDEPGVKEEIFAAAARSIDLRRGDRDPWLVQARANFAFVYWNAREFDRLRDEIVELDNTVCGMWMRYDKAVALWRGARVDAGLDPDPRNTVA